MDVEDGDDQVSGKKRKVDEVVVVKMEMFDRAAANFVIDTMTAVDAKMTDKELAITKKQVKAWFKGDGKVEYKHVNVEYGRIFGQGYQGMPREVRALLAQKHYWDVNMVNAQPNFLHLLAEKKGWTCTELAKYCSNREEVFADIIAERGGTRDSAKELATALVFGSRDIPFALCGFAAEIEAIRDAVFKDDEYSNVKALLKKKDKTSLLSYVLKNIEHECLMEIERALIAKGRQMDSYIFDGGLVRKLDKETEFPAQLLRDAEAAVEEFGWRIRLAVKPMETELVVAGGGKVTNEEAARLFFEANPHKYVLHRDWGCYKLGLNNVWILCGKDLPSTCRQDICDFLKTRLPYSKLGESTTFLNNVKSLLQDLYTTETLKMDAQEGMFCFSDCIYDLKTRERRPIKPEDYISTTCGYPYPTSNATKKAEVVQFLKSLHENDETYAYLLKMLAYTCIGGNPLQLFFILTGAGGNGKGMLMKLQKLAMGPYYGTVMIDLFTRAHDESKPSPTLVKVRTSRLVVAEEPEPYQTFKDGFLKILSGHTPITCRLLHSNHVITYVALFVVFLLCNAIPEFASIDAAVARRIHIVPFPFNFRAHPAAPNERPIDTELDGSIHSEAWRNEMILLLLDHMSPTLEKCPAVELATAEFIDRADPVAAFLRDFYVEDNKAARIQSEDLRHHYNEQYPTQQQTQFEFKQSLDKLKVRSTLIQHVKYYFGLRPKPVATEVELDPKNINDRNIWTMEDF